MAVVVSEPTKELVGGGENAKYIKECTEMYLRGKGIEKIRGFEPFVNLESLWINGNKLKKLNNLDAQTRLKALYAHDNQICTLKGSLLNFKFLETLDLSNNQLRDLDKQLRVLERFKFLKELNLEGNPMCEEPDYRLIVIHRMPGLTVLDQHVITPLERRRAAGAIGGDVATLTVAFGKRVPPYDPAWDEKVPELSVLERDMTKEATTIRDNLRHEAYMQERGMYLHDPHPEPPRGTSLPPNAGTVRAMQVWRQRQEQHQQQQSVSPSTSSASKGEETGAGAAAARSEGAAARASSSGRWMAAAGGRQQHQAGTTTQGRTSGRCGSGSGRGNGSGREGKGGAAAAAGSEAAAGDYPPRDKLVLYTLRAGHDPLADAAAATSAAGGTPLGPYTATSKSAQGTLRFEAEEYSQFLQQRAAGAPGWQLGKAVVPL